MFKYELYYLNDFYFFYLFIFYIFFIPYLFYYIIEILPPKVVDSWD